MSAELSPISNDKYEELVKDYTPGERVIFARGVLAGSANLAEKLLEVTESNMTDSEKVDVIAGQSAIITLAIMMSGAVL